MLKRYKYDFFLIIILIVVGIFLLVIWFIGPKTTKGSKAIVYRDGIEIKIIELNKNAEYKIDGMESQMIIEVHNGFISVKESGCKNQICVNHYEICNKGSSIICLPNKVEVRIEEWIRI